MGTLNRVKAAFPDGTLAVGTEVDAEIDQILAEFNGNIDAVNLGALAVTTAKLQAQAVDSAKLANLAVRHAHVDYTITNSGPKVLQYGPGYGAAANNGMMVCMVEYSITSPGAPGALDAVLNFSTGAAPIISIPFGTLTWAVAPSIYGVPICKTISAGVDVEVADQIRFAANTVTTATLRHYWAASAAATAKTYLAMFIGEIS